MPRDRPRRRRAAVGLACLAPAGCGGGPAATTGPEPPPAAERVTRHLLDHGAVIARDAHPDGHWFPGSVVLPRGGPTCAVASITTGAHGPLVTDAVFDPSGTVTVRIRAAAADRARCVAAVRRALRGFTAG